MPPKEELAKAVQDAKDFFDAKKLSPATRHALKLHYSGNPDSFMNSDGTLRSQDLWDSFRASDPVRKHAYEHEVAERVKQQAKIDGEEARKHDTERAEAMRGESVRETIERTVTEAQGRAYEQPQAPKNESVRATLQRSMEQLRGAE